MQSILMWTVATILMMFCFCAGRISKANGDEDFTGRCALGIIFGLLAMLVAHYA